MKFPGTGFFNRIALVTAIIAHLLAWAAFLWLAFWPHAYQGVSTTPVNVNATGQMESQVVRRSASFTEVNGIWVLIPLFIPVPLTGQVLVMTLTGNSWGIGSKLLLWGLATALLLFCGLGALSFGILYLPAALALLIAAIFQSISRRPPPLPES